MKLTEPKTPKINIEKIAKALGAKHIGKVKGAEGGLAMYIERRKKQK